MSFIVLKAISQTLRLLWQIKYASCNFKYLIFQRSKISQTAQLYPSFTFLVNLHLIFLKVFRALWEIHIYVQSVLKKIHEIKCCLLCGHTIDYEVRSDKTTRRISLEAFSEVLNHGFRQSKTDSTQLLQLLYAKWISDVSCGFCKLNITLVHIRWHQDPSHFGTMLYTLYYQVKY